MEQARIYIDLPTRRHQRARGARDGIKPGAQVPGSEAKGFAEPGSRATALVINRLRKKRTRSVLQFERPPIHGRRLRRGLDALLRLMIQGLAPHALCWRPLRGLGS